MSIENMKDGGPAFPRPYADDQHTPPDAEYKQAQTGMSLLDYFAGQAMVGMLANESITNELNAFADRENEDVPRMIAVDAYDQAEEMLHERERRMKK